MATQERAKAFEVQAQGRVRREAQAHERCNDKQADGKTEYVLALPMKVKFRRRLEDNGCL